MKLKGINCFYPALTSIQIPKNGGGIEAWGWVLYSFIKNIIDDLIS